MSNKIICKFHLESLTPVVGAPPEYPGRVVNLWASHDSALSSEERFSEAVPSGRLQAQITNPAALEFFLKNDGAPDYGKEIYLILTTERPE